MSESTMHKSWRDYMQPIIAAVLAAHPDEGPERRAALRKAYPAGERAHHPYWHTEEGTEPRTVKFME